MIYALTYMISVIISSLIMLIALCIKAHKINPNDTVPSEKITFILLALGAMLVPGLNLIVSISYLYRVLTAY